MKNPSHSTLISILDLVAKAVDRIGTPDFPATLAEICDRLSSYDSLLIYVFATDCVPELLFSNLSESDANVAWIRYFEGAYLLDPFYELYCSNVEDGLYHLREIAPDDFYESEYFKNFYQTTQLRDESTIIVRCNENTQVHLSLGLRDEKTALQNNDLNNLIAITPVIIALCRRHWPDIKPGSTRGTGRMGAHLRNAFRLFGSSHLSNRECEIAKLILMGHSGKSIARVLGISPETVKVHRKRIHTKLDISSQAGLFSIFLEGLRKTPVGANTDPLESLDIQAD